MHSKPLSLLTAAAHGFPARAFAFAWLTLAASGVAGADPSWKSFSGTATAVETAPGSTIVRSLRGDLTNFAWRHLVWDPSAALHGAYAHGASAGSDLRVAPLALSFTTPDGTLEASARAVFEPRRVDTSTGRPLRPGAPAGATCATGAEPDCLVPGDAPAANRAAFDAICSTTRGFSGLDLAACELDLFRSQVTPIPGVTVAMLWGQLLAGSASAINLTASPAFLGPTAPLQRAPFVSLSIDPGDGVPTGFAALNAVKPGLNFTMGIGGGTYDAAGHHNAFQTLAQVLTPQQQALLACGGFYPGTTCDGGVAGNSFATGPGGIDLLHADAGALLQSFAPLDDETFVAKDGTYPQPGTVGAPAPACDRDTPDGGSIFVPGCRGPADTSYAAAADGPNATAAGIGFPAGILGVPALEAATVPEVRYAIGHPFTGQSWRSEMAALSWNLQIALVAFSLPASSPLLSDPRYGFDPAHAYRTTGCSYVKPQLCSGVRVFASRVMDVLAGDPQGRPSRRWMWEHGARYAAESASGIFAGLAGADVFGFGPGGPPASGAAAAAAPILALEAILAIEPDAAADADGDGVANASDRCPATADPLQTDSDSDGIGDACDDCTAVANPDQRDTNGDGFGNACDADLDGNGVVNFADLAKLKSVFFQSDPDADLDGNGTVNFADLALMKQRFFRPPGPSALAP